MSDLAYLCQYEYLGRKEKLIVPAASLPEANAKMTAIQLTGEITGHVYGEIKGDSRLLVKLFGEE